MEPPRLMTARRSAMRLLALAAVAAMSSCAGCDPAPESLSSGEDFVVLPRIVHVPAAGVVTPVSLRLEVVAQDAWQNPITPTPVVWESSDPAVTFASSGMTAVATLPAITPGNSLVLKARHDPLWSSTVVLFDAASTAPWDEARAATAESPSVAFLTGHNGGGCAHDQVEAFVGGGRIGQWDASGGCDRADVAIFTEGARPLIRRPAGWTSATDLVDASANGGPISIPIQLVIGVPAELADQAVADEANYLLTTGDTYRTMRSGIDFPPSAMTTIRQPLPASVTKCADLASLPASVAPDPAKMNIYHLSVVNDGSAQVKGFFCTPNVILIGHGWALVTTLAHEFGHALGLIAPMNGHTDPPVMQGFIRDNVMSTNANLGQDARFRFSLGQLYRMHVDGRSWLRRGSSLETGPFTCPCDPYSRSVCPALAADIRPLTTPLPPAGGTCP